MTGKGLKGRKGPKRILLAVALGFAAGLCVGPASVFAINARDALRSNEVWPAWTPGYFLTLFVTSLPAGVNGAIGAGAASRWGSLRRRPVTILPATLHVVVGLAGLAVQPRSFIGFQWYTLMFTVVIWSAGRIGQRIGRVFPGAGRRGEPSTPGSLLQGTGQAS